MGLFAHKKNLFVVGDPDQIIYSWRHASIDNFERLEAENESITTKYSLDVNYRSTGNILRASQMVINQGFHHHQIIISSSSFGQFEITFLLGKEKSQIRRDLHTLNIAGPQVTLKVFKEDKEEAEFIASEIRRYLNKDEQQKNRENDNLFFFFYFIQNFGNSFSDA